MNDVVIIQDPNGLSMRVLAMQHAHPRVVAVAPSSRTIAHCLVSDAPEEWLPDRPDVPPHKREWFKGDAMALAAVVNHHISADFFWFIESDVVATQERWKAFFRQFERRPDDCLCLMKIRSGKWIDEVAEADCSFLMAAYRLSRKMVDLSIEAAPAMRNVFCEVAVPLVAKKNGIPIGTMGLGGHFTRNTIGPRPRDIRVDPKLINHPVKSNTYGP